MDAGMATVAEACRRVAALEGAAAVTAARVRAVLPGALADGRAVPADAESVLRGMRDWERRGAEGPLDLEDGGRLLASPEMGGWKARGPRLVAASGGPGDPPGDAALALSRLSAGRRILVEGVEAPREAMLDPRGLLPAVLAAASLRSDAVRVDLAEDGAALLGYAVAGFSARAEDLGVALAPLVPADGDLRLDLCLLALAAWLASRGMPAPPPGEVAFGLALGR